MNNVKQILLSLVLATASVNASEAMVLAAPTRVTTEMIQGLGVAATVSTSSSAPAASALVPVSPSVDAFTHDFKKLSLEQQQAVLKLLLVDNVPSWSTVRMVNRSIIEHAFKNFVALINSMSDVNETKEARFVAIIKATLFLMVVWSGAKVASFLAVPWMIRVLVPLMASALATITATTISFVGSSYGASMFFAPILTYFVRSNWLRISQIVSPYIPSMPSVNLPSMASFVTPACFSLRAWIASLMNMFSKGKNTIPA